MSALAMAMAALGGVGEACAAVAQRDPIVSTAPHSADPGTSADLAEAPAAPAAVIMERDEPVPKKNKRGVGSFGQRWNDRSSRSAVVEDMKMKCCSGMCVDKLTVDQVIEERTEQKKHGSEERRSTLRSFLEDNANPNSKLGYNLHPSDDSNLRLCASAFDTLRGYGRGYTYRYIRGAKHGIGSDDCHHGGARVKGQATGDAFADDSSVSMGLRGWWSDLRVDTELMPNTSVRELDYIEESDLYKEYRSDMRESGCAPNLIAGLTLWKSIWHGEFGDVKIRKHKRVSGKDRKRAFLRYLLRRKVTRNKADRDLYKTLRGLYRDSCRRERTFYWVARLKPAQYPLLYMTQISDGATQADYVLPRVIGTELKRACVKFKLVGNLVHGHAIVIHLVCPHVADNSNLVCHCSDTTREEIATVRTAKGQPAYCPPNWRLQVDGVNTQWGSTTFAHHSYLHDERVLGATTDIIRNKVGDTHEDVDGLFGMLKVNMKNKDIITPSDLEAAIRETFEQHPLPVGRLPPLTSHFLAHF